MTTVKRQPIAVPPIFVWDSNDLTVFESVEAACGYLEPENTISGRQPAFDSVGRLLVFGPDRVPVRAFGVVLWSRRRMALIESEPRPTHAEELRTILVAALGPAEWASSPLVDLVEAAQGRFGVVAR
jgi:hypothetical protein